jgi:iron complex outermembrane receptor protein
LLTGSFDIYDRKTTNLLAQRTIPPGQGLTNDFIDNVGEMNNRGVELNLTLTPIKQENFTWSISGNMGYNKGKVTKLESVISAQDGGLR